MNAVYPIKNLTEIISGTLNTKLRAAEALLPQRSTVLVQDRCEKRIELQCNQGLLYKMFLCLYLVRTSSQIIILEQFG